MFSKIGYEYKIGKFNAMYNRAKEYAETSDDKVSIRHFQMAISEMHSVEWKYYKLLKQIIIL
jgi:hypothetical protein